MRASFHARNLVLVAIAVIAGCVGVPEGIEPVTGFQVERYMGRWYEVARLDHRACVRIDAAQETDGFVGNQGQSFCMSVTDYPPGEPDHETELPSDRDGQ